GWLPKLIATDLDGTLVRSDSTVSGYSKDVLRRVRDTGITLVGVTGRRPRLTALCHADMPDAHFFVYGQGGHVVDNSTGEVLHSVRLPGGDVAKVLAILEGELGPLHVLFEAGVGPGDLLWGEHHEAWPYPERIEPR